MFIAKRNSCPSTPFANSQGISEQSQNNPEISVKEIRKRLNEATTTCEISKSNVQATVQHYFFSDQEIEELQQSWSDRRQRKHKSVVIKAKSKPLGIQRNLLCKDQMLFDDDNLDQITNGDQQDQQEIIKQRILLGETTLENEARDQLKQHYQYDQEQQSEEEKEISPRNDQTETLTDDIDDFLSIIKERSSSLIYISMDEEQKVTHDVSHHPTRGRQLPRVFNQPLNNKKRKLSEISGGEEGSQSFSSRHRQVKFDNNLNIWIFRNQTPESSQSQSKQNSKALTDYVKRLTKLKEKLAKISNNQLSEGNDCENEEVKTEADQSKSFQSYRVLQNKLQSLIEEVQNQDNQSEVSDNEESLDQNNQPS